MAKTCDIVFVQAHWRGFGSGKVYTVIAYWRSNGSAYKGSKCPYHVSKNWRRDGEDEDWYVIEKHIVICEEDADYFDDNVLTIEGGVFTVETEDGEEEKYFMPGADVDSVHFNRFAAAMDNMLPEMIVNEEYIKGARQCKLAGKDREFEFLMNYMEERAQLLLEEYQTNAQRKIVYQLNPDCGGYIRDENGHKVAGRHAFNGTFHKTPKNSIVHISPDGDIDVLAANKNDSYSERTLLDKAVTAGGCKTTAYEQDHEFYMRAGFVPVAWVRTEEKDYPAGFDPDKAFSCDQIVYLHASKCDPEDVKIAHDSTLDEWKKMVKPSKTVEYAEKRRDDYMNKSKGISYEDIKRGEKNDRLASRKQDRWGRPSVDSMLNIKRKKTKKADLPDTTNWSDWENARTAFDEQEFNEFDISNA